MRRSCGSRQFSRFEPIHDYDAFFDELYDTFASPESWELFPEVTEVLSSLKNRGYKLGVISNWDSRLPGILQGQHIDEYFTDIVISSQVGFEKPDSRIFQLAVDRMSIPAHKAVHVGDDPLLDYRGAFEAGLYPCLVDRKNIHNGDIRTIKNLRELLAIIL